MKKLIDLGFKDVKSLEDGMLAWAIAAGISRERKLITTFATIKTKIALQSERG